MSRVIALGFGVALMLTGLALLPLPGPFTIPAEAIGLVLILRSSRTARRLYVRGRQRFPKTFHYPDRWLKYEWRRPRFLRRKERLSDVGGADMGSPAEYSTTE